MNLTSKIYTKIRKFNGGARAILCSYCYKIIAEGSKITKDNWDSEEPMFCNHGCYTKSTLK